MFCPASVKAAGHGAIPARRLLDIVRSLPDGEVRVRSLENHWVQIGSGRSTFKLAGMAKDNFPALPDVPAALAEVPGRTLGGGSRPAPGWWWSCRPGLGGGTRPRALGHHELEPPDASRRPIGAGHVLGLDGRHRSLSLFGASMVVN